MRATNVDAARTAVQSFVTTRLDYCNSVMYVISDRLRRLQSVQNAGGMTGDWGTTSRPRNCDAVAATLHGCQSDSVLSSRWRCWCISHWTVWLHRTCQTTVNLSPMFAATDFVFDRQTLTFAAHRNSSQWQKFPGVCLVLNYGTVFHPKCVSQNCTFRRLLKKICLRLRLRRVVTDYSCIYTLIHSFLTDLGHGISSLSGDSREISFLYKAAANKEMKYSGLANSHLFFPVIIGTSRVTNQLQAVDLV